MNHDHPKTVHEIWSEMPHPRSEHLTAEMISCLPEVQQQRVQRAAEKRERKRRRNAP